MSRTAAELSTYILVGLVNSAVGLAVIFAALTLGLGDLAANAAGYAVGLALSFFLNGRWTFRQRHLGAAQLWRFGLVTAVAYLANVLALLAARDVWRLDHRLAQLCAMAAYTLVGFVGARAFAFRTRQSPR
jgi:putative flippase GtrA